MVEPISVEGNRSQSSRGNQAPAAWMQDICPPSYLGRWLGPVGKAKRATYGWQDHRYRTICIQKSPKREFLRDYRTSESLAKNEHLDTGSSPDLGGLERLLGLSVNTLSQQRK
jgi:hypothetical protein